MDNFINEYGDYSGIIIVVFIVMVNLLMLGFMYLSKSKTVKRVNVKISSISSQKKKEFKKLYNELILRDSNKFNAIIYSFVAFIKVLYIFLCPAAMALLFYTLLVNDEMFFVSFATFFITVFLGVASYMYTNKTTKINLFPDFVKTYFPNYKIDEKQGIKEEEYCFKNIKKNYDDFESDNLVEFILDEKYFVKYSRVSTLKKMKNQEENLFGIPNRQLVFDGISGYVKVNTRVENPLCIYHDLLATASENHVYISSHDLENTFELDNELFNEIYKVAYNNEVEIYKYLKPQFMEDLISLHDYAIFDFLIEKDRISFRVHTYNLFSKNANKNEVMKTWNVYDSLLPAIEKILLYIIEEFEEKYQTK